MLSDIPFTVVRVHPHLPEGLLEVRLQCESALTRFDPRHCRLATSPLRLDYRSHEMSAVPKDFRRGSEPRPDQASSASHTLRLVDCALRFAHAVAFAGAVARGNIAQSVGSSCAASVARHRSLSGARSDRALVHRRRAELSAGDVGR